MATMHSNEFESMMYARNAPDVQAKLKAARIAIAGLGGLGSNIAMMLARIGVGTLLLVDFDVVELSNLNRQHYNLTHLGQCKTEALQAQIKQANPFITVYTKNVRVDEGNAQAIFAGYPIVCEAFDNPQSKADITNELLEVEGVKLVAASGMAGYGCANEIKTVRRFANLYVCGDFQTTPEHGLMAPRVIICAGHQANMVLRLILEENEV
ncbi:MAG: sulfur carrier protein ThiS adenylyltransferase ThiF [Oscillospiraceae bacterium]|nr:sulfur carrier protein ThiS adenylyltransferase ThiF [Oscillospiraceae bacterium]